MTRLGPNRHHGSAAGELLMLQLRGLKVDGWVAEHRFLPDRRFRFDVAFPDAKIAMECDGGVWTGGRHTRGVGATSDAEKFSLAAIAGWRVLRCTPAHVRSGQAVRWILDALGYGGTTLAQDARSQAPGQPGITQRTSAAQEGV